MSIRFKGIVLIIISACAFGSIGVTSRIAIDHGGGETSIMIMRFAIVSLFFLVYMRINKISWKVSGKNFIALILLGFVCYGNIALMFFLAMRYISPSLGSLILYTYPAIVMAGSILFLGESFSKIKLAALLFSLFGCAVVLWGPLGQFDYRGLVFALLTAFFYAGYIIGSKKIVTDVPPATAAAYMAVCCLVYFIIYGVLTDSLRIELSAVNISAAAVLALWCTIIGFLSFLTGLRLLGAQNAAIISTFEPLYTIVLAWLVIGDRISVRQIIGGCIITGGVLLLNIPSKIKTKSGQ